MTKVSCPGRVCLGGEDLDWMVGPSLLGAVDMRLTVVIEPNHAPDVIIRLAHPFYNLVSIPPERLAMYDGDVFDYVRAAVTLFGRTTRADIKNLHIGVELRVPPAAGMASSAAVVVSTLAALNDHYNTALPINELLALAYRVEAEELRTGAGQMDFYGCAFGGLTYLDCMASPPDPLERLRLADAPTVMVIDTRLRRSTKQVITGKRQRWAAREPSILNYAAGTLAAVTAMRELLVQPAPDWAKLGTSLNDCHALLRDAMLASTDIAEASVRTCLEHGAYGAKITGSGSGGCIFAMLPPACELAMRVALTALPVDVYSTRLTELGVVVHGA